MKPRGSNIIVQRADGRTLLQFRDGTPTNQPLKWCFFGGGAEGDETPAETAARELSEEISINATAEDMEFIGEYDGLKHYVSLYRYKKPLDWNLFKLTEGAGVGFFTLSEMKRIEMTPDNRAMLDIYPEVFQ